MKFADRPPASPAGGRNRCGDDRGQICDMGLIPVLSIARNLNSLASAEGAIKCFDPGATGSVLIIILVTGSENLR